MSCCCGRSNHSGSRFTVLDAGHSVNARKSLPDLVSRQCELASIHYVRIHTSIALYRIFTIFAGLRYIQGGPKTAQILRHHNFETIRYRVMRFSPKRSEKNSLHEKGQCSMEQNYDAVNFVLFLEHPVHCNIC